MEEKINKILDRYNQNINDNDRKLQISKLGKIKDPAVIPHLIDIYKKETDDASMRNAAILAISTTKIFTDETLDALLVGIDDKSEVVRRAVVMGLGKNKSPKGLPILLDKAKNDPSELVRGSSTWALGQLGLEEGLPILIERCSDPHWVIRKTAAEGLGNFSPTPERVNLLINLMKNDSVEDVRKAAIRALGQLKAKEALPDLKILIEKEKSANVRVEAKKVVKQLESS
ncbi:MAG: HEAT repeat domain-containing protein [Candidatus Hodarchaeota archaeon]